MFKPALKLVVRLLPFAAAMLASVAIGASAQAPEAPEAVTLRNSTLPAQAMMVQRSGPLIQAAPGGPGVVDVPLLARMETFDLLASAYPVENLDKALTAPAPKTVSRNYFQKPFELPRPDRWTSLLATLALGAFFFLRRIV